MARQHQHFDDFMVFSKRQAASNSEHQLFSDSLHRYDEDPRYSSTPIPKCTQEQSKEVELIKLQADSDDVSDTELDVSSDHWGGLFTQHSSTTEDIIRNSIRSSK